MNISVKTEKLISPHFKPLLYDKNRHLMLRGGAGSGKSHFAVQKKILRILDGIANDKAHKFLFLRKTATSARNSIYALTRHYLTEWKLLGTICRENSTRMEFDFPKGAKIICGGLDDPEKINSIEGITGMIMEEASQFTKKDIELANLRLRGQSDMYFQIIYPFNPVGKKCYIYQKFYKNGNIEFTSYDHSTYTDNQWIDEHYGYELDNLVNQDETYYRVYRLGEWGELKGLILTNWDVLTEKQWPTEFDDIIYGEDFGFNNPSALLFIGLKDDELYWKQLLYERKLTNTTLIQRMKTLIPSENMGKAVYADAAEPARIEEINAAGFNCHPAIKSVKDGLDYVKAHKVHVHEDSTDLIDELEAYKYKEDKEGNALDEPVKFNDHLIDCGRYGSYTNSLQAIPGIFAT